jgi:hypothetical protein
MVRAQMQIGWASWTRVSKGNFPIALRLACCWRFHLEGEDGAVRTVIRTRAPSPLEIGDTQKINY